ncbi:DUF7479 domain-containing protein [Haloarchaeobius sp. HRN-SO-5]|uniref:DUF7479 domain-containing protein n=1 Tax=Haloarchaeobius sp. HRN-SO-5 TaxID=3446118 RepID=UPI003EBCCB09
MTDISAEGGEAVSEFDLSCASCGGSLSRTTVSGDVVPVPVESDVVVVAECTDCGSRYFPKETLDAL